MSDETRDHRETLPDVLARPHAWARRQPWLARLAVLSRILLAVAFFPTGMTKLLGERFTVLPVSNPIGFFFEAMYQTGPYWHFIGLMQVIAAVLLLIPATATLGAVFFLPIIVSVFLVTWGIGFGNTVLITFAMMWACLFLVCWDGDRVWAGARALFGKRSGPPLFSGMPLLERVGWLLGGFCAMALTLTTRGFVPVSMRLPLLGLGVIAAGMVAAGWLTALLRGSAPPDSVGAR